MILTGGTEVLGEKSVTVTLCQSKMFEPEFILNVIQRLTLYFTENLTFLLEIQTC
jgi:hypothetical protein